MPCTIFGLAITGETGHHMTILCDACLTPMARMSFTLSASKLQVISKQCICLIALKTLDLSILSIFETKIIFLIQNLNISIYFENGLLQGDNFQAISRIFSTP
jgi:hypothetical protein